MSTEAKTAEAELVDDEPEALALEAVERANVDISIATAKRFPRSIRKFRERLQEMATLDPDIAEQMWYSLPRGKNDDGSKKFVEGPSIRLAECAVAAWGNTRSGSRPLMADKKHVTCQSFAHDLESNNYVTFEVKRRITDSKGRLFNEDMQTVTTAAGSKIAWRNAIFGVIPRVYIEEAVKKAKACVAGTLKSMTESRKAAVDWWKAQGEKQETLFALFGRGGADDLTLDDLVRLRGIKVAVEEGQSLKDIISEVAESGEELVVTPESLSKIAGAEVTGEDNAKHPDKKDKPAEPPQKVEKPQAPEQKKPATPTVTKEPKPAKAPEGDRDVSDLFAGD